MTHHAQPDRGSTFSPADLTRIQAQTPIQHIEFHPELASTNDLAQQLVGSANLALPGLVLTEKQTAGRGRQSNLWWSAAGALTFSLVLNTESANLPPHQWPQASLTAGLAVAEALENLGQVGTFQLKWPNDVYLNGRKTCGILVEAPDIRHHYLVIGVGINVNNSLATAPAEIQTQATALCDQYGTRLPLVDVLIPVLNQLSTRLAWIGTRNDELHALWRQRCFLTNQRVQIDAATDSWTGICQGIDQQGALLLKTPHGIQRCLAGSITLLET